MPNGVSKGGNASKLVRTSSDKAGATVTPPDDRGKKEKRGEDDDKRSMVGGVMRRCRDGRNQQSTWGVGMAMR